MKIPLRLRQTGTNRLDEAKMICLIIIATEYYLLELEWRVLLGNRGGGTTVAGETPKFRNWKWGGSEYLFSIIRERLKINNTGVKVKEILYPIEKYTSA